MKQIIFIIVLITSLNVTAEEMSSPTFEELKPQILTMFLNEEFLSNSNPYTPSANGYKEFNKYMKELFKEDIVLRYLYDIVTEYNNTNIDMNIVGEGLGYEIAMKGMKRLDDQDAVSILNILTRIYNVTNTSDCADLFTGEKSVNIYKLLQLLPSEDIQEYFRIVKVAVLSELKNDPPITIMSEQQINAAMEFIFSNIKQDDLIRYSEIYSNIRRSSKEDVCWCGRLLFNNANNLTGIAKNLAARVMVTQI